MAWSQLLHGDLASRPFGDVDLLVPGELLPETLAFIRELGLQEGYPTGLSPSQALAWRRFGKAQNFLSPTSQCSLDLHWRLFSQWIALDIPFSDLWQRRVELEVQGLPRVSTFGVEDRVIFTALHGAQDGWSHLKGLLDLALFLERHPPRWQTIVEIAGSRLPLVRQAVTFAAHLLGARVPPGCELFYPDPETTLSSFIDAFQQTEEPQLALLKPSLWIGSRARASARVLKAVLTPAVDDIMSVNLPSPLINLYILVRLIRLLDKFATRRRLK